MRHARWRAGSGAAEHICQRTDGKGCVRRDEEGTGAADAVCDRNRNCAADEEEVLPLERVGEGLEKLVNGDLGVKIIVGLV